jgi:hypothetical protein
VNMYVMVSYFYVMVWKAIARKLRPSCWCEYVCDGLILLCDGLEGDSKDIRSSHGGMNCMYVLFIYLFFLF